jgi:hypothetical protein
MPPLPAFSHDQAVKNLIKDYPVEALEFLASDVIEALGPPTGVEFLDPAVSKDDAAEPGPGQAMDLAIRYTFERNRGVLLVLVEHWSDADKLDLLRTARYYLDLCRRFPDDEILPVALVDDDRTRDLNDAIERGALGSPYFRFQTRIIQIPSLELDRFRKTANRVALSFLPNMRGDLDPVDRVIEVALAFRALSDPMGMRKFFALWVVEAGLQIEQERELNRKLKEMDMPEIITWWIQEGLEKGRLEGREEGLEQGLRQKATEDARKMLEHGISWEIITDITGLRPEDLLPT